MTPRSFLLAMAQAGPLDELQRARCDLLRSAGRVRPRVMAVTRSCSCSARPGVARRHWTSGWPARPTWRRSPPRCSSAGCLLRSGTWPGPHVRRPRHRGPARGRRSAPGRPGAAGHGGPCGRATRPETGAARLPRPGRPGGGGAELAVARRNGGHSGVGRRDMARPGQPSRQARAREAGALSELPLAVLSRYLLHAHAGELEQGAAPHRGGAGGRRGHREPYTRALTAARAPPRSACPRGRPSGRWR